MKISRSVNNNRYDRLSMNIDNLDLAGAISTTHNGQSFQPWNMSLFDQLTSLQGRINRLRFLMLNILSMVLVIVYAFIFGLILGIIIFGLGLPEILFDIMVGIVLLPVMYVAYAISVKRLQDMNWGDGWTTYLQVITFNFALWGFFPEDSSIGYWLYLGTSILAIPLIVVLYFAPGEKGTNRFGPNPLGP